MKKLFTTLIVMGAALCTWAATPPEPLSDAHFVNGVLTIDYSDIIWVDEHNNTLNNPQDRLVKEEWRGKVKKLVLTGNFTNDDFLAGKIVEKILERATKKDQQITPTYLDLTACNNIVSKVEYTGTGTADYATKNFKYVYSISSEEKDVTKGTFWVEVENGNIYNPGIIQSEVDGSQTKYYYSSLYEMGTVFAVRDVNNPSNWVLTNVPQGANSARYKILTDNNGTLYYHLFYDSSAGSPQVYNGAYQSNPNADLPDLAIDESGKYYYSRYYRDEQHNQLVNNPVNEGFQWDPTRNTYVNPWDFEYVRDRDGKIFDNTNGYNQVDNDHWKKTGYWIIETNSEYTGGFPIKEGDKWYYYEYAWADGTPLTSQQTEDLNKGQGSFDRNNRTEIVDDNGNLIGYHFTNFDQDVLIANKQEIEQVELVLTKRNKGLYPVTVTLEERKYYLEERKTYVEEQSQWYYTENNKPVFVKESDVFDINGNQGKVNASASGTPLTFEKVGPYINGVSFPCHENFTAIPDKLCDSQYHSNLETVVLGDHVEWIGTDAFKNDAKLKNVTYAVATTTIDETTNEETTTYSAYDTTAGHVTFPNTMKAIGIDAFYGCLKFESVNLNLPNLVRVDAAAFNMVKDELNNLNEVILPGNASNPNTTLRFWGNQVFSSSHITTLNMEYLYGIKHFAYDGYNYFGEGSGEGGVINPTATFTWMTSLQTLILPRNLLYAPGGGDENSGMCSNCTSLTTVKFTGVPDMKDCEIQNKLIIGEHCFRSLPLTNVTLSDNVAEIYQRAFDECQRLEKIEIPASVEELQNYSFNHCSKLTTVVFKDKPASWGDCNGPATVVRGGDGMGAFYNCQAITDVYVNRLEPALKCENYSFDYYITWGHADPTRALATLHVPKTHVEDYVNLKHYLTDAIIADPGLFHLWLHEHIKQAAVPYKNGWYEFINAGPIIPDNGPAAQEIVLRTFSDWQYSYLVPNGLRAYVVNKIYNEEEDNSGNYVVKLQRIRVIPANTGVILYGHPNGKTQSGNPAIAMTPVAFGKKGDKVIVDGQEITLDQDQGLPLCRANWNLTEEKYKNFLEPTSTPTEADLKYIKDANEKARIAALIQEHAIDWKDGGKHLKSFENIDDSNNDPLKTYPSKPVAYRNFGLGRYDKTEHLSKSVALTADANNYVGFFRLITGWYKNNQAYLHLKGAFELDGTEIDKPEYNETHGAEILVLKDEPAVDIKNDILPYYYEYDLATGVPFNARQATFTVTENNQTVTKTKNPNGWWDPTHTPIAFDWNEYQLSWGDRTIQFGNNTSNVSYNGEFEEDADGVVKLVIPAGAISDGEYYTLQGIKISNPTKGVYIRNGKKVIIK